MQPASRDKDDVLPSGRAKLEHLGIAVRDPDDAVRLYQRLIGVHPYKSERVEREGVRTHFIGTDAVKLELLEALSADSPVAKYLEKRGEGLHHVAFEVEDIHAELARLKNLGFTPLSDEPRPGADGKLIFFLHPRDTHGVLVEFCQATSIVLEPVRIPFQGKTIAAYEAGSPSHPTVLLLHGAAGSTTLETGALFRNLEPHYHVLALDFTGHGASDDLPNEPLSMMRFAESAAAVLDHFEVARAHVFGFSMGGAVALLLAWRYPDRVRHLAVHATNVLWDDGLVRSMNARLDLDKLEPRYPQVVRRIKEAHGPERWPFLHVRLTALMETLPTGELAEVDLQQIPHPTLVSAGDRDELFGADLTLRLRDHLPNSTLAILPGTRHSLTSVDADLLAKLVRSHFR